MPPVPASWGLGGAGEQGGSSHPALPASALPGPPAQTLETLQQAGPTPFTCTVGPGE